MFGGFSDSRTQERGPSHDAVSTNREPALFANLAGVLEAERPYWFYWVPVFVGVGSLIYFTLDFEPDGLSVAVVFLTALGLRSVLGSAGTFASLLTGILLCASLGFLAGKIRTEIVAAPVLQERLRDARVEGFVELVEARDGGGVRVTVQPTRIAGLREEQLPSLVRVVFSAKGGRRLAIPLSGDHIAFTAVLSPPPRAAAPGGFDFSRYAFFRGIGAVGYATSVAVDVPMPGGPELFNSLSHMIGRLRQRIGDRVTAALPGQTGAIAKALINGDRSGISEETNEAYRASGLFHILSISGLHMAIMGGSIFFALRFMFALSPWLALQFPIKKWAAVGAIAGSLGYLTISGGSFATERSFIMIVVFFASILVDRPAIALRNVAIAALVILLVFPESVIDPGFQMSFAAVVGLVASYEFVRRRHVLSGDVGASIWGRGLMFAGAIVGSTLVASLAVAPIGIFHFHQTQHFAVLANLAAVPICNLIVMPAALATLVLMPFGGEWLALAVMGPGLDAMAAVARWVAGLSGAVSYVGAIPGLSLLLMAGGGLWLCLWRQRWRLLGLLAVAVGILVAPQIGAPDLLIGDGGQLVMVRDANGQLTGPSRRQSNFILARWLERDGDKREPREVGITEPFHCDRTGCVAQVKGQVLAFSKRATSLRDDCARADIVVVAETVTQPCKAKLVVDRARLRRLGTHAIEIAPDGSLRIETVAEHQGYRPWTRPSD